APRLVLDVSIVRKVRDLLQRADRGAAAGGVSEQRAVAAGVDHESRFELLAGRGLDDDARSVAEVDARHRRLFAHLHAVLPRVIEQKLIEARSLDLKRALVRRLEILVE